MRKSVAIGVLVLGLAIPMVRGQDIGDLIRLGKIQEARELLSKIEKENKPSESVLFLRGLLSTRGDSAEYYYTVYLEKHPDGRFSDEALFRLAQLKYAQGLYRSARERFDQILRNRPLSPFKAKCLYWSGLCCLALGQKDSSSMRFQRLNREFPESEFKDALPKEIATQLPSAVAETKEPVKPPSVSYSIQIGAFTNQNNALLRKAFFEKEGYSVLLKSKHRDDEVFYLVWLGTFSTWEEAKSFGEGIKAKYGSGYTLVSE